MANVYVVVENQNLVGYDCHGECFELIEAFPTEAAAKAAIENLYQNDKKYRLYREGETDTYANGEVYSLAYRQYYLSVKKVPMK